MPTFDTLPQYLPGMRWFLSGEMAQKYYRVSVLLGTSVDQAAAIARLMDYIQKADFTKLREASAVDKLALSDYGLVGWWLP